MSSSSAIQNIKSAELSLRCRLYVKCDRLFQRLIGVLTATQSSVWLGLLEPNDYNRITIAQYESWNRYRRDDHTYSGLFGWEESAIADYFPKSGAIVIGASGGGREALALSKRGYQVACFDCTTELLTHSVNVFHQASQPVRAYLAPPSQVPEELKRGSEKFGGAVIGWGGYMHIHGRETRVEFLRAIADLLEPGAPLLVSFIARKRGPLFYRIVCSGAKLVRVIRRRPTNIEIGDMMQSTFDHHFSDEEIAAELNAAGLDCVRCHEESFPHAVGIKRIN